MRISDWSSDVCSSDLHDHRYGRVPVLAQVDPEAIVPPQVRRQLRTEPIPVLAVHPTDRRALLIGSWEGDGMRYVKLGRTGLDVSPVCLGCMSFGVSDRGSHPWSLDEATSRPLIKAALDGGINFFDQAKVYSDGPSEEIVGKVLGEPAHRA